MKENWCALCVCILRNVTPEQAFLLLEKNVKFTKNKNVTDEDIEHMIELRKEKTFQEIGDLYGLNPGAVYTRIKRYLSRKAVVNQ